MQPKRGGGSILPSGELLIDRTIPEFEHGDYQFDGTFYQTVDLDEYHRRQQTVSDHLETAPETLPVDVYQQWVELDWKEPHGTYRAVERLTAKAREEAAQEAPEALHAYRASSLEAPLREAAISELGDTLWVTVALASNSGISLEQALQSHIWGNGLLSPRVEALTVGKLDTLVSSEGLAPRFSPPGLVDLDEPVSVEEMMQDEGEPIQNLALRAVHLATLCAKQFGYGDTLFSASFYRQIAQAEISPVIADQTLLVAWYAHHWLNSSLTEVIGANVPKIRERVLANLVDKADGDRALRS